MTENELLAMIIDELTEYRLSQYRRENADEYAPLMEELSRLGTDRQNVLKSIESRFVQTIEDYDAKTALLADKDCAYLYMQGAKDCVRLLKSLGVL